MRPDQDAYDWCWFEGVPLMQDIGGYGEPAAKKLIGRLGNRYGFAPLREALSGIRLNKPREPMSYLTAILKDAEAADRGMSPSSPPKIAPSGDAPVRRFSPRTKSTAPRVKADDPRWEKLKEMLK